MAIFPGPDSESTISRSPQSEDSDVSVVVRNDQALKNNQRAYSRYHYDYFGPGIDTEFSLPHHTVISQ